MKIGTWNLEGESSEEHLNLLSKQDCDVWLLTEVNPNLQIGGYRCYLSREVTCCGQHWAAVLSHEVLEQLPDPHPASAAAKGNGITYCSSVLPWIRCDEYWPWAGNSPTEKTEIAIKFLLQTLPKSGLVWGGDWNHPLKGSLVGSSKGGQSAILAAIEALKLDPLTAELMNQENDQKSIDHVAVPAGWTVKSPAVQIVAKGLSDHDAYTVEVEPT